MSAPLVLAANNGGLGGAEIMQLALAEAARELGADVLLAGPDTGDGLLHRAAQAGFAVVPLPPGRPEYMRALRRWDSGRHARVLWCLGLVPALATTGRPGRVLHLHRVPRGAQYLALGIARAGVLATWAPSEYLARRLPGGQVLPNWTRDLAGLARPPGPTGANATGGAPHVGFLGRLVPEKGVDVLAAAMTEVHARTGARLVVAGEPLYGNAADTRRVDTAVDSLGTLARRVGWVDPTAFLPTLDVLVVPSVEPESFGLVAAEAMSAGVPLVVTAAGGLAELPPRGHPWVVPPGDPAALAGAVVDALQAAPERRAALVAACRERWESSFSPSVGRRRLAAALREVGALG